MKIVRYKEYPEVNFKKINITLLLHYMDGARSNEYRVLLCVAKLCGAYNRITSRQDILVYAEQLGISVGVVDRNLPQLVQRNIVARFDKGAYVVNPNVFPFPKDHSDEVIVSLFPDKKDLNDLENAAELIAIERLLRRSDNNLRSVIKYQGGLK